jgi:hypothetical protein
MKKTYTFKWEMWDTASERRLRSGCVRVAAPSEFETWRVMADVSPAARELVAARAALRRVRLNQAERRALLKGAARIYIWRTGK